MSKRSTHESPVMWTIDHDPMFTNSGKRGFYCGTFNTRTEAIAHHCRALGSTWQKRRKNGDRAVKIRVTIYKP